MKLMNWLHGSWILEQPASSLMTKHPAAPAAVDPDQTYKINTFLGSYRHWCPKLTSFFSNKFFWLHFGFSKELPRVHEIACLRIFSLKLRLWVDGLYKTFDKRRKQLSERRRVKLGLPKTVRRKGSKVYGNASLKATQYLCIIVYAVVVC